MKKWMGRNQTSDMTSQERYWEKVRVGDLNECWTWEGGTNNGGYGVFGVNGKTWQAHRFGWMLHSGEDPHDWYVLHKCDNRLCQNPAHLFLGTLEDNNKDRHDKGRSRGAPWYKHNKAKLTPDIIKEIRQLYGTGQYTQAQIAGKFGVVHQLISQIVRNEIWTDV